MRFFGDGRYKGFSPPLTPMGCFIIFQLSYLGNHELENDEHEDVFCLKFLDLPIGEVFFGCFHKR